MPRRLVLCALVLAFAFTAPPALAAPSAGCSKPPLPHRFFSTFQVDGVQRSALVNVPPAAAPGTPLALVLMYHGAGSTGPETERTIGLTPVSNQFGFIVVYPDANGPFWDLHDGPNLENGDVSFTRQLLDLLEGELCVDTGRVYAAGGSYGGGFVTLLGCDLADRLAAVATVAGLYGVEPPCQPQRPLSILEIHGTADQTVPYAGSGELGAASVASFLSHWLQLDDCPAESPAARPLGARVVLETWSGCAGATTIEHVKLIGEQHVWPRPISSNRVPFNASLALWEFFSTQTVNADTVPPPVHHRRRRHR